MAEWRLEAIARACRVQIIRMLTHAGSGHPGGSLSVIDLLVSIMFGRLRHDPTRPDWPERDHIVLSKGHAVPALYTVMAKAGYFPEERLITLRKLGSPLQGHPDRTALPGIEAATGSLGEGLSIALGMALGLKMSGSRARVYCILGDGEIQEGQVWEAAMSAPKLGQPDRPLDNLTVILDYNKIQLDDFVAKILDLEPVVSAEELVRLSRLVPRVFCDPSVRRYVVQLVQATRHHAAYELGASPRGSLSLFRGARALAAIRGRDYVLPDDVKFLAPYILSHRAILNSQSRLRGRDAGGVLQEVIETVPVPVEG